MNSSELGAIVGVGEFDPKADVNLSSRMEMARSINDLFQRCQVSPAETAKPELWAWLTVTLFDRLKTLKGKSSGAFAIWYPESRWTRFYRHVLYGPWRVYRLHSNEPELVQPLLHGKVTSHGEFFEQIAAYQELAQSPGVLGAARALYWNEEKGELRRGHAAKGEHSDATGSVRRFSAIVQQLALTWDISDISADELLELLPTEFDRWKS